MPFQRVRLEVFQFIEPDGTRFLYNITKAKEILSDGRAPILNPSLDDLKGAYAENSASKEISDEYAMTRDLAQPIIAIIRNFEGNNAYVRIIDGWHRIRKAILTNTPSLPCHVLLPHECEECQLPPDTLLSPT